MKYDQINSGDLAVHGGLYFGKVSDDPYEFNTVNPSNGYHLILRHNGVLRLYRHVTTQTGGIQLGAADIATDAPVAGQSMTIQIDVTPTTIEAHAARQRRLDHRTHRRRLVPRRVLRAQQRQHQRHHSQTALAEPVDHPTVERSFFTSATCGPLSCSGIFHWCAVPSPST